MRGAGYPREVKALVRLGGVGMEVVGMVADTTPSSGKGVRYGAFGGGGVTALVVEVLLGVGRFDVDRGAEMAIFDTDIDVQKGDMGRGGVPGEVDGILTVELFQEISEGVLTPQIPPSPRQHLKISLQSLVFYC